jgi:GNAT superfamily N-acetyltransferase
MADLFCRELGVSSAEPIANILNHVTVVIVAEDGERLVGCVGAIKFGDMAIGEFLYVPKERRGGRTAKMLMTAIEDFAKSANCSTFKVVVSPQRQLFYEKFGLEHKLCVMEKTL